MRENIVEALTEIRLDGQDFILRFRALAYIEYADKCDGDLLNDVRALGINLAGLQESTQAGDVARFGPLFGKLRDILWAGLVDAHPQLSRDDVARLFSLRDFQPLAAKITEALRAGLPDAEPRPMKPATGQRRRSLPLANGADSRPDSETQAESGSANSAA